MRLDPETNELEFKSILTRYRSGEFGEAHILETARHGFSRLLASEGERQIQEGRVLSSLEASPRFPDVWTALVRRHPKAGLQPHIVLQFIVFYDAIARMHKDLPAAQAKAEAKIAKLLQATQELQDFFFSEMSGYVKGGVQDPGLTGTTGEIHKALRSVKFMSAYLSGRLASEHGYVDFVLPQKQSRQNLALSFAGELCKALSGFLGSPCYTFVEQVALALYPGEAIGDIAKKFRAEVAATKPLPKDVEVRVAALSRTVGKKPRLRAV